MTDLFRRKFWQIDQPFEFIIPAALGFGIYFSTLPLLLIALYWRYSSAAKVKPHNPMRQVIAKTQFLTFFLVLSLFFGCYWGLYIPYQPQTYVLPRSHFPMLVALSMLGSIWVLELKDAARFIQFIWLFCLGTLLFCLITIGASVALEPPPYYGRLIYILSTQVFSIRSYVNSPGVSNLLCFFPIVFMASLLLNPLQRPKGFWVLGITGFFLSLCAAIIINQRSYFLVTLLIEPILVGIFLALQRSWRAVAGIIIALACYPGLWLANSILPNSPWNRPLNGGLMHDGRFQMLSYWFKHLIQDPFTRIEVGPAPLNMYPWFHNFFADIHRLSGFWALVAAALLISYIFYRLILLIRIDRSMGFFLLAIAIPMFLIMNTSIVPEGERQPFLLLIFIGVICEKFLTLYKKNSVAT